MKSLFSVAAPNSDQGDEAASEMWVGQAFPKGSLKFAGAKSSEADRE